MAKPMPSSYQTKSNNCILSEFYRNNPSIWFRVLKHEFKTLDIVKDSEKFMWIARLMENDRMGTIKDFLCEPISTDICERALIDCTADLDLNKALTGDEQPIVSQEIIPSKNNLNKLASVWLQKLTSQVRDFLYQQDESKNSNYQAVTVWNTLISGISLSDIVASKLDIAMKINIKDGLPKIIRVMNSIEELIDCLELNFTEKLYPNRNISQRHESEDDLYYSYCRSLKHIHIEIVGPLPKCNDYMYCLTVIDRHTKWPDAVPLKEISPAIIASNLYKTWISKFGVPDSITTCENPNFNDWFQVYLTMNPNCKNILINKESRDTYDIIGKWQKSLNTAIKCNGAKDWLNLIPTVLFYLKCSYKEDINGTAAWMLYGSSLPVPASFFTKLLYHPELQLNICKSTRIKSVLKGPCSKSELFVHRPLHESNHVFVEINDKSLLQVHYEGPFDVLGRQLLRRLFTINFKGRVIDVSMDHLKPAFFENLQD